jgi:hypothetical protein
MRAAVNRPAEEGSMNSVGSRAVGTFAVLAVAAWLIGVPAPALAQAAAGAPVKPVGGLGYGFFGIGAASTDYGSIGSWHVGGGGEAVFWDELGIGAEIGCQSLWEEPPDRFGMLSVNGAYHFNSAAGAGKWRPFVTGGYTLIFDSGSTGNLFNIGAGVDYWFRRKVGVRVEFRDHIWTPGEITVQYLGVRFGVTFR